MEPRCWDTMAHLDTIFEHNISYAAPDMPSNILYSVQYAIYSANINSICQYIYHTNIK